MTKNKELNNNICFHGFTFGFCPHLCIRFLSLKEKVAEDRRQFLKAFHQTPKSLTHLQARKRWPTMQPEVKTIFIQRLIQYHRLEQRAKY